MFCFAADNAENGVLDPRAGRVDVVMPEIQFDARAIVAEIEELRYKKFTRVRNRKCLSRIIDTYTKFAGGDFPIGIRKLKVDRSKLEMPDIDEKIHELDEFEQEMYGEQRSLKQLTKRKRKRIVANQDLFDDFQAKSNKIAKIKHDANAWVEEDVSPEELLKGPVCKEYLTSNVNIGTQIVKVKIPFKDEDNIKVKRDQLRKKAEKVAIDAATRAAAIKLIAAKESMKAKSDETPKSTKKTKRSEWEKSLEDGEVEYLIPSKKQQLNGAARVTITKDSVTSTVIDGAKSKGNESVVETVAPTKSPKKALKTALKVDAPTAITQSLPPTEIASKLPQSAKKASKSESVSTTSAKKTPKAEAEVTVSAKKASKANGEATAAAKKSPNTEADSTASVKKSSKLDDEATTPTKKSPKADTDASTPLNSKKSPKSADAIVETPVNSKKAQKAEAELASPTPANAKKTPKSDGEAKTPKSAKKLLTSDGETGATSATSAKKASKSDGEAAKTPISAKKSSKSDDSTPLPISIQLENGVPKASTKKQKKTATISNETPSAKALLLCQPGTSTPKEERRVKIALKMNRSQEVTEYITQLKESPAAPYDSAKKPLKGALKQGLAPSPINPFYKRLIGMK